MESPRAVSADIYWPKGRRVEACSVYWWKYFSFPVLESMTPERLNIYQTRKFGEQLYVDVGPHMKMIQDAGFPHSVAAVAMLRKNQCGCSIW